MRTFVFLHGSFHAAWNWHKVIPLLEKEGHICVALDLPGHGLDDTPPRHVSLEHCVAATLCGIDKLQGKAIVVAHSRNGIVASQTAERCPERIEGLIYLAAYLVPGGKSMMEYAIEDTESLVVQNVVPALDRKRALRLISLFKHPLWRRVLPAILPASLQTHRLKKEAYKKALYHDCPEEITKLADALLEPEPNWAGFTPLQLSEKNYGSVPRVYIECLQDRAVTLGLQRKMVGELPCAKVFSLDAGHSPFFSQPDKLAAALIASAAALA